MPQLGKQYIYTRDVYYKNSQETDDVQVEFLKNISSVARYVKP